MFLAKRNMHQVAMEILRRRIISFSLSISGETFWALSKKHIPAAVRRCTFENAPFATGPI